MPVMTIKPGDHDPVKKPGHYTYGRYECIDIIEDILADARGPEGFLIGNAIKYLWRFRHKNGTEDLEKARWYLDRAITRRRAMDGTRADTAIIDVAPGTVPIRDNRPVFGETTTWAAARLTGQNGEFFDAPGGTRKRGILRKITGPACDFRFNASIAGEGKGGIFAFFSPLDPQEKPDA